MLLRAVTALLLASTSASCCTAIYVPEGLEVRAIVAGGLLPPDHYAIVAVVEGHELRVEVEVVGTAVSCASRCEAEAVLASGGAVHLYADVAATGGWIRVASGGGGGPEVVDLRVVRGAAVIGQATYRPSYRHSSPNGEGCDEGVLKAEAELTITP